MKNKFEPIMRNTKKNKNNKPRKKSKNKKINPQACE